MSEQTFTLIFQSIGVRTVGYVLNAGYHDRPRLPVEFRNDREIVLTCLQHRNASGWLFEYASEELKATREVVLAVVQNHGQALRYASAVLRDDEEIVIRSCYA